MKKMFKLKPERKRNNHGKFCQCMLCQNDEDGNGGAGAPAIC